MSIVYCFTIIYRDFFIKFQFIIDNFWQQKIEPGDVLDELLGEGLKDIPQGKVRQQVLFDTFFSSSPKEIISLKNHSSNHAKEYSI